MRISKWMRTVIALNIALAMTSVHAAQVTIKILGINDFHGQLSAGNTVNNRPVGGAAVLSSYLHEAMRGYEQQTLITLMGDVVGASIPVSALLNHEPTMLFINSLGNGSCTTLDKMAAGCNIVATVGNHEFDRGQQALHELYQGTHREPTNHWINLPEYPGAAFPAISANILDAKTGKPVFPPYVIKTINGVPIAFVGAILKNAASTMLPENAEGVQFVDEAQAINQYIPEIRQRGVKNIVVIMHEGGDSESYNGDTRENVAVNGVINNIVSNLDDGVEVVMAGHTHRFLNAYLPNKNGHQVLVTQADSYSAAFADVTLHVDQESQRIVDKSARIVYTFADQYPGTQPDAKAAEIVTLAEQSVAPMVNEKIGVAKHHLSRFGNAAGESELGNLIADSFRTAMHADIGMTNSTSIRTNLSAGVVTWGALYAVQPFQNPVVKITLSGQDIKDLLAEQWKGEHKIILQLSGLSYTYNEKLPIESRFSNIKVGDELLDVSKTYTVGINTYLAFGGSGFSVFRRGKIIERGETDLQTVVAHIKSLPQPFTAQIEGRIKSVG